MNKIKNLIFHKIKISFMKKKKNMITKLIHHRKNKFKDKVKLLTVQFLKKIFD